VGKVNSLSDIWSRRRRLAIGNPNLSFPRRRQSLALLLPALVVLLSAKQLRAQDGRPTESQVKAAYLYNFGKFVQWPDRVSSPDSLAICVLGRDPFGPVLDSTVAGENIDGRKIFVKRLIGLQEAASCSILFVSSSEESRLAAIIPAAQRMKVLTVSDIRNFIQRGGAIGFLTEQGKIRFEVNRKAAEQCHVSLSSELLKVATRVIEKPIPGN
jgi:hypothetical protein